MSSRRLFVWLAYSQTLQPAARRRLLFHGGVLVSGRGGQRIPFARFRGMLRRMIFLTDQRRRGVIGVETLDAVTPSTVWRPQAALGWLDHPYAVQVDSAGTLFVADGGNARIVAISAADGTTTMIQPPAPVGPLRGPRGLAIDGDLIVIADTDNHRIVFGPARATSPTPWSAFGTASVSGSRGVGEFKAPVSVHVDSARRIVIADPGLGRLVRIDDSTGAGWTEVALPAGTHATLAYGLAAGPGGDTTLITDPDNGRILVLATDGAVTVAVEDIDSGSGAPRQLVMPVAACMHGDDIVVADAGAAQVTRWTPDPDANGGAGGWKQTEHLIGVPGPLGGPQFSQLTGLAIGTLA